MESSILTPAENRFSDELKIVLIIQARMGSARLPNKSMMDLAGVPLVGRIIERLKYCKLCDQIVLATTHKEEDNVLESLALEYDIGVFRGSEDDVVDRYYHAASAFEADVVVRFPADNPVPEPAEIDRMTAHHLSGNYDFSSNLCDVLGSGYPDGIGAEVFSFDVLQRIWQTDAEPRLREHLTLYFYDYYENKAVSPSPYRVGTVSCPKEFRRPELVLDVNTLEQYRFMSQLYEYLYPRNPHFTIQDVIHWYDSVYSRTAPVLPLVKGGKCLEPVAL